jgi:uncharacterized protein (TIGR02466 family)
MLNFNISDFLVYPAFSSTIAGTVITEDLSKLNQIKKLKFLPGGSSNNSLQGESRHIFLNFQKEKDIVMSYFNKFKNDVLQYKNTDFEMTTSWATKTMNNTSSHPHSHKNSYYSGILYLDFTGKGGEIEFEDFGLKPSSFLLNIPTDTNLFNCQTMSFTPEKNLILFFPSYVVHSIRPYFGSNPRYSIAFNIHPVGKYGCLDSYVDISLNASNI